MARRSSSLTWNVVYYRNIFQTYLNHGLFGLVYINHSSILWWFRCLLVFWMYMKHHETWTTSSTFHALESGWGWGWVDDLQEAFLEMLIIIRHHSYMLNHVFFLIFPDTAMAPTYIKQQQKMVDVCWCPSSQLSENKNWPILFKVYKPFSNRDRFASDPNSDQVFARQRPLNSLLEAWSRCKIHLQNNWGVQIWVFP